MPFPLGEWIDRHAGVRHNLAQSGLRGTLPSLSAALRTPREPDADALRRELARVHGISADRIFLTHGATEAATLVLLFLRGRRRSPAGGAPTFVAPRPEYPPLSAIATWTGFTPRTSGRSADVRVCSSPNNPTGLALDLDGGSQSRVPPARATLVDETFREFTDRRSEACRGRADVWTTGSFTKVYGADHVRAGFVVAPPPHLDSFAEFHGVTTDELAAASVSAARAILRDRGTILAEARERLRRNAAILRGELDGVPALAAPLYFDRGRGRLDGDGIGRAAVRRSVLVCPGSYFNDAGGVRICLTQPSFREDLRAYLAVRERWLGRPVPTASRSRPRRTLGRSRGAP